MSNVLINKRTAVHAGSQGQVTAPDVCKTPSKCRPQTYSNVAMSSSSAATASSVIINGNPACHKNSNFSTSSGDEPGSCGGAASGTIKQKAEFITFSSNVLIEGIPAVRQNDLMVSNNKNTPPVPLQQPGAGAPPELKPKGARDLNATDPGYELAVDILGGNLPFEKEMLVIIEEQ
ncbi:Glycerate kinase [hydrothermal vent metagenome]|uniref:Glycerate kinase n=1 Tax=hydrothermal vent metagenome TaxID=652676 RepID=A0A3B0Y2T9_9ZZZZ